MSLDTEIEINRVLPVWKKYITKSQFKAMDKVEKRAVDFARRMFGEPYVSILSRLEREPHYNQRSINWEIKVINKDFRILCVRYYTLGPKGKITEEE